MSHPPYIFTEQIYRCLLHTRPGQTGSSRQTQMNYNTIIIIIICSSKHQCMNTINCARQATTKKKSTELANSSQHSTAVSRLSHTLRARRVFVSISLYSIAFLHFINRYQVNAVCVLAAVCSRNQPGTTTTTTMCGPQLRSR